MHAFAVLGLVFPYQAKRLAWGTSLKLRHALPAEIHCNHHWMLITFIALDCHYCRWERHLLPFHTDLLTVISTGSVILSTRLVPRTPRVWASKGPRLVHLTFDDLLKAFVAVTHSLTQKLEESVKVIGINDSVWWNSLSHWGVSYTTAVDFIWLFFSHFDCIIRYD